MQCKSNRGCDICGKRHNTMLHHNDRWSNRQQNNGQQEKSYQKRSHVATSEEDVVLATALVKIVDGMGTTTTLRALIDTGSQLSLITESAAQTLRLPKQKISANINGLGNGQSETSSSQVTPQIVPRFRSNFT